MEPSLPAITPSATATLSDLAIGSIVTKAGWEVGTV
jgi:hypothetical protein